MSADNWAECPRCLRRAQADIASQQTAVQARYGKIPADEFIEALAMIPDAPERGPQTFREDYEIYGAATGVVTVSYSGGCGNCGLSLNFKYDQPIEGIDK